MSNKHNDRRSLPAESQCCCSSQKKRLLIFIIGTGQIQREHFLISILPIYFFLCRSAQSNSSVGSILQQFRIFFWELVTGTFHAPVNVKCNKPNLLPEWWLAQVLDGDRTQRSLHSITEYFNTTFTELRLLI